MLEAMHVTDLSLLGAEWQVEVAHALTELGGGDVAMVVPAGQGRRGREGTRLVMYVAD